jgi:hypothetical protein
VEVNVLFSYDLISLSSFSGIDTNVQCLPNKSSFIYENNVVLYERGLDQAVNNDKREITRCNICKECWSSLKKEKIPKYSAANKAWIGDVPKELQCLTIAEKRLISIYRYNSCIVKLQSSFHSMETAQSALKGNCISFPQNVVNIAETLPLTLDQLCESLNILTVRKRKVLDALRWLNRNNSLYRNVVINSSNVNQLPDDDVPECLWTTMQISTNVEDTESERTSYIPDPLKNAQKLNDASSIPLATR